MLLSGGKDSAALVHYLHTRRKEGGWEFAALHVNHHLRGEESDRDACWCREFCAARGIPFFVRDILVAGSPEAVARGVEHAARIMRYRVAEEVRHDEGFELIATAHTADDQLESFFVDVITGASLFTLGGIAADRDLIVRPFINVTTAMVTAYLEREGIKPVFDSSNADTDYVRNRVRLGLLPLLEEFGRNYTEGIKRIQEESRRVSSWLKERTRAAVRREKGCLIIDRKLFETFDDVEKRFLLGSELSALCRSSGAHIKEIFKALQSGGSKRINLPGNLFFEINPDCLRVFPAAFTRPFCVEKKPGEHFVQLADRTVFFEGGLRDKALTVRSRRQGDSFRGKKLKDLFYSKKLTLFHRDRAVVLEAAEGIVCVQHIEENDFKVDE